MLPCQCLQAGEVVFAEVLQDPSGRSKGCGIVEFASAMQVIKTSISNFEK